MPGDVAAASVPAVRFADIAAAVERLAGHARRTPMLSAPEIDALAGRRVLVKAECLQRTGSFKFRGGLNAVASLPQDVRARGVIAYSSGNHAQGVALAAQLHGVPAVIVMPADAPRLKLENTAALGAEVVTYDRNRESREEIGAALAADRELTLIRPYDEPAVIAGQGTCGLEIALQAQARGVSDADVLVCCGGGGLSAGIALALAERAHGLRVRPVEPEGFDDVRRSLAAGRIVGNDRASGSICDAILTPAPGDLTFPILQRLAGPGLAVHDGEALRAMAHALLRLKIVLEPGGAVALAAALFRRDEIEGDAVVVVATGGNVDPPVLGRALDESDAG